MIAKNDRLKLAVQKSGRITEDSLQLLRSAGLEFEYTGRSLLSPCENFPLDILWLRDDDIPEYVQDGVSDLGIVGFNVLEERRARVRTLEHLGFGRCRLSICVPQGSKFSKLTDLRKKRIATSYPRALKRYLSVNEVKAEIIEISGSVELAPALDVADAICDLVSTGSTARVNGLEPKFTVFDSEAILIANNSSLEDSHRKKDVERLIFRIRCTRNAHGRKYVMMNAPASKVAQIRKLVPGMKSPTVVPLANPHMVAVHSVVAEDGLWEIIEKLKQAGASDIIVVPIEKMIS
jgi:ATP phosphoribosyltransferase